MKLKQLLKDWISGKNILDMAEKEPFNGDIEKLWLHLKIAKMTYKEEDLI